MKYNCVDLYGVSKWKSEKNEGLQDKFILFVWGV